ncbi:MAG: DMT family transporter [Alphaproteobacteria bacterium]
MSLPKAAESGTAPGAPAKALPPLGFVLLAALALFWGGNWPAMKLALAEIQVWPFRSMCLIAGGGALLILSRLSGGSIRVPPREIRPLLVCVVFNILGWQMFSGYGVSMIEAGRASIIAFTMPVWAALFSRFVLGEALTGAKLFGLALGVTGLAVLIGPDLTSLGAAPLGAALMLGAAISWALGTVIMKRFLWTIPVATLAGWQLLIGAVPITLGALAFGEYPDLTALSTPAMVSLAYVLTIPMVFCHWAWFTVVRLFPAAIAAIGTLAIPIVGVFSSALVLGEPVGLRELTALALVCTALAVVLVLPALSRARN